MNRALAAAVAALLVLTLPGFALAGPGATLVGDERTQPQLEGDAPNTSVVPTEDLELPERLILGTNETEHGEQRVGTDVGTYLDGAAGDLEMRHGEYVFDKRMEKASTEAEERAVIREEVSRLDDEVSSLREREEAVYGAYAGGELGEREAITELIRNHQRAVALEASIEELENEAQLVSGIGIGEDLEILHVQATTVQSPVREHIVEVHRGEASGGLVQIEADETGVVLATMDERQYLREAYRLDHRVLDSSEDDLSLRTDQDGLDRISELYPWARSDGGLTFNDETYRTHVGALSHSYGTTTTMVDRTTAQVYKEDQTLRLNAIPTAVAETETGDGYELELNRTYPGGPTKVTLTDSTGEPVDGADVTVDGTAVGETAEGERWFVAPHGSMTVVAAVDGNATVGDEPADEARLSVSFDWEPEIEDELTPD
ncbi:DUF7096 domain-containing protein [Natronorarus salvus]|uniref:DUF7096 domain-containing protein n=1 Tax=Natronorarus salvus TaxID=3117733 RepID=UPI002F26637A